MLYVPEKYLIIFCICIKTELIREELSMDYLSILL